MNKSSLMLVTLGVLGASAIIRDSRVNRGTSRRGHETAARDRLVGTGELVSAEYMMKDGSKRPYPDVGRTVGAIQFAQVTATYAYSGLAVNGLRGRTQRTRPLRKRSLRLMGWVPIADDLRLT